MIHLVTLNPAIDLELELREPKRGKIGAVKKAELEAGGKALNIARFFKKWGLPCIPWMGTGGGALPTHTLYRALLEKEGLGVRFLSGRVPIRINVVTFGAKGSGKYNQAGRNLRATVFFKLLSAVSRTDWVVLTGRLPAGMKPGTYAAWIEVLKKRGVVTVLDSSGKPLEAGLKARPSFFKVNLFEFEEALGRKFRDLGHVARILPELRGRGLGHGVVTDGPRGALVWDGETALRAKGPTLRSRGPLVGAGDAFLTSYLKAWKEGHPLEVRCRNASAAAFVVARHGIPGFQPGLVRKAIPKVLVKRS